MNQVSQEQIRQFRLHTHHLDRWYAKADIQDVAGSCGFQNSPPGAWENALCSRIPGFTPDDRKRMLETEKTLLQAWSFRGAPVVFPTAESDAFLSALISQGDEPWIYTRGIGLALEYLQMPFETLLSLLQQIMPRLDGVVVETKAALDQTIAEWMLPVLPPGKRDLWNKPSMYGSPETQTVGGAVVSFLLRPCSCLGLVVFGRRKGTGPAFTSYIGWTGHPLQPKKDAVRRLVGKYLRCYGPASPVGLADWLGCSPAQAGRMWQTVQDDILPVEVCGRTRYILADDMALLLNPPQPKRKTHLLAGHDPYLGLQDRDLILGDRARQRQIWQTVSNPGAVLHQGAVAGMWKPRKKGKALEPEVTLWDSRAASRQEIEDLCQGYASAWQLELNKVTFLP